jgi:hypothetical protein
MSFLFRAAFYVFLNRLLPTSLVSVIQKSHQLHKRRGVKREFSVNFSSCSPVLFVERIRRTKGSTENPRAFYNGLSSFPMLREMRERSSVRREPMMFVEEAGQTGKKRFAVYWCAICQPNYPTLPLLLLSNISWIFEHFAFGRSVSSAKYSTILASSSGNFAPARLTGIFLSLISRNLQSASIE